MKAVAICLLIVSLLTMTMDCGAAERPMASPEAEASPAASSTAGWFIDDVIVLADTLHKVLNEDFETGGPGWTHGGTGDDWQIGAPGGQAGPAAAHGGLNCAATNLTGLYNKPGDRYLQSPDFNLSMAFSAQLTFYEWYDLWPNDSMYVSLEAKVFGLWQESDPIETNGSGPEWTQRDIDFTQFKKDGLTFAVMGASNVHVKFRLVSVGLAHPRLMARAGDGYVRLDWVPPSGPATPVTGYNLYRGASPGTMGLLASLGNVTEYNDTNVTNGVTYYYFVAAVSGSGEGEMSEVVPATPGGTPDPPLNPNLAVGNRFLNLSWMPPADDGGFPVTDYAVYRGPGPSTLQRLAMTGNRTYRVDLGVTNESTYYYAVSATNKLGEGPQSPVVNGSPGREPSAPGNLTAWGVRDTIHLSWQPPPDADRVIVRDYVLHRWNCTGPWIEVSNASGTAAVDRLNRTEVEVYYNVTAVNEYGESEPSRGAWLGRPSVPQALVVAAGGDGMDLIWKAPRLDGGAAVYSYNIYRSVNGSPAAKCGFTTGNSTDYHDGAVEYGVQCSYCITAVNAVGESAPSEPASPLPDTTLPQVLIMSPGHGIFLNTTEVALAGVALDPAGVKLVEVSSGNGAWSPCNGTDSWQAVVKLGEGNANIVVRATDRAGNTGTASIDLTVDLTAPVVRFDAPANGSVLLVARANVSGVASDNSRLTVVELSADGLSWSAAQGTGSWTGNLSLKPGPNTVYARARDAAGNIETAMTWISMDTQDPTIAILSPNASQHFFSRRTVTIEGSSSDDIGVRLVELRVDGGCWTIARGTAHWYCNITLGPGDHVIRARATDIAGRKTVTELELAVSPAPPASQRNDLLIPAVVLLMICAVLVLAGMRFRKKGRK